MRMYLGVIFLIIAVLILTYILFSIVGIALTPTDQNFKKEKVCFKDKCFKVELAQNQKQRERGLMYKENLDKNEGMFFIFEKEGIYPFWMKNTLIPLDIIWINKNKEVVFIGKNIQPCKNFFCPQVVPDGLAKFVLEVNSGVVDDINLRVGDILTADFVVK